MASILKKSSFDVNQERIMKNNQVLVQIQKRAWCTVNRVPNCVYSTAQKLPPLVSFLARRVLFLSRRFSFLSRRVSFLSRITEVFSMAYVTCKKNLFTRGISSQRDKTSVDKPLYSCHLRNFGLIFSICDNFSITFCWLAFEPAYQNMGF